MNELALFLGVMVANLYVGWQLGKLKSRIEELERR